MTQHYRPMLAQSAKAPFSSKDWIFEIKWDGIRAISYVDGELSIRSRNGKELKRSFPELEELRQLANNVVMDGEIVVMKNGKPDFQAVAERVKTISSKDIEFMSNQAPATYIVFDILEKDGKQLINVPLTERKGLLSKTLKEGKHVVLSIFTDEQGELFYTEVLKKGLEGVIAKRKSGLYTPGVRTGSWLKIKKLLSCDCAIFGYTQGKGTREGVFGALLLGLYDNGKPVYVGKVGTGFSRKIASRLMEHFSSIVSVEKTLESADVAERVIWLRPKLVCEVGYQAITGDGKLRIPRFLSLRNDKEPSECTLDQLGKTGLEDYVSKRDFSTTPEPKGAKTEHAEGKVFVVQEHHARRLHYDLRLEKDGVLRSWAVPKGMPEKPGDKRLAVQTEDHPIEYAAFEGTIPEGQYGEGTVKIWDRGTFETKVWNEKMIEFTVSGERIRGRYVLAKFKRAGEKDWLLLKARD